VPEFEMSRDQDETIRIVIADGDPLARRTLSAALKRGGLAVVAEATTAGEAIELAQFYSAGVIVLDSRLAGAEGIGTLTRLHTSCPAARVLVLSADPDDGQGLRMLRAGAAGYLEKAIDLDILPRIVWGVAYGEAGISRRLAMTLIDAYRRVPRGGSGLRPVRSALTDREWEVLDLLSSGQGTEDIARALVLSTETVRSHLKNLYRKLGVRSRAEAVEAAERLRELVG